MNRDESTSEERISLASSGPSSCAKRCLGGSNIVVVVVVAAAVVVASRHHQALCWLSNWINHGAKCCTRILCKGKGRKNLNKIKKETGVSNFEPIDGRFSFHFFPRGPGKSKR